MIKLIVFDFGGVYFTYNYLKLINELSKELDTPVEEIKRAWHAKLNEFTKGECNEKEFFLAFLKSINKDYELNKLHQIIINQFKPISEMQDLINKLKQKYRIGLFTDQTDWIDDINSKYNFYHQFDLLLISKNEGTQKSEEGFYEILVERANCKPNEIVLIDDTLEVGYAARRFRLNFIHYQSQSQLEKDLKELGIEF